MHIFVKLALKDFNMSEVIKEVVAKFVKMDPGDVVSSTPINSKALLGSIQMHRMYAQLAEHGIVVDNYVGIQTFGQLLDRLNTSGNNGMNGSSIPVTEMNVVAAKQKKEYSVGIDIEPISSFPRVADFREDEFYKQNFSASEISYCVMQQNQLQSFAGLFAAKEALVKADNRLMGRAFNAIIIDHAADGKPQHDGFQISISHTDTLAVAVAVQLPDTTPSSIPIGNAQSHTPSSGKSWQLPLALLLSLAAIILWLITWFS